MSSDDVELRPHVNYAVPDFVAVKGSGKTENDPILTISTAITQETNKEEDEGIPQDKWNHPRINIFRIFSAFFGTVDEQEFLEIEVLTSIQHS